VNVHYRAADFTVDGALRDVVVLDARLEDWQRVLASLAATGWQVDFDPRKPGCSLDISVIEANSLLSRGEDDYSPILAVAVGDIWFTCYFFDVGEIEFSFDPADVSGSDDFAALCEFVEWLGDVCGKRVVVTMESSDHASIPPLIEYLPSVTGV